MDSKRLISIWIYIYSYFKFYFDCKDKNKNYTLDESQVRSKIWEERWVECKMYMETNIRDLNTDFSELIAFPIILVKE